MSIDRMKRVDEMIRREVSQVILRIVGETELDRSAVTVTRVETDRSLRSARVFVSIRDHESERDRMLSRLKRHRTEIQSHLNQVLSLKYTPKLLFTLDTSLAKGDHVLDVLHHLEEVCPSAAAPERASAGSGPEVSDAEC